MLACLKLGPGKNLSSNLSTFCLKNLSLSLFFCRQVVKTSFSGFLSHFRAFLARLTESGSILEQLELTFDIMFWHFCAQIIGTWRLTPLQKTRTLFSTKSQSHFKLANLKKTRQRNTHFYTVFYNYRQLRPLSTLLWTKKQAVTVIHYSQPCMTNRMNNLSHLFFPLFGDKIQTDLKNLIEIKILGELESPAGLGGTETFYPLSSPSCPNTPPQTQLRYQR
jgi:hypothetical protein